MIRLPILIGLICILCGPLMAAVPIPAVDVVIIADESLTMLFPPHGSWLKDMVQALDADYLAAGVGSTPGLPNQYALIGYGSFWPGHGTGQAAHSHGGWMNAASMVTNINALVTFGLKEDGYQAISYALTTLTFRPGAYKTIILITDEDRDSIVSLTRATVFQMLEVKDATLNVIVNADFDAPSSSKVLGVKWDGTAYIPTGGGNYVTAPGGYFDTGFGTTKVDYVELSWATCGSAWDVEYAKKGSDGEAMADALSDVKVQELIPVVETVGAQSCADWILAMGCLRYDGGQDCWFWFEYREMGSLTWKESPKSFPAPGEGLFFLQSIGGLQPDTWYQVRAWVENAVMKAMGPQVWNISTYPAGTICPPSTGSIQTGCGTCCGSNL